MSLVPILILGAKLSSQKYIYIIQLNLLFKIKYPTKFVSRYTYKNKNLSKELKTYSGYLRISEHKRIKQSSYKDR